MKKIDFGDLRNSRLFTFGCFAFFIISLLVLLSAVLKAERIAMLLTGIFGLVILVCIVSVLFITFKHYYKNFAACEGRPDFNVLLRDIARTMRRLFVVTLILYIAVLIFTITCDKSSEMNLVIFNEVRGLTSSLKSDTVSGFAFVLLTATQLLFAVIVAAGSCVVSGIRSLHQFRVVFAVFFTIIFFIVESFIISFAMSGIVVSMGGIQAIFTAVSSGATALIFLIESLLYCLISVLNLLIIRLFCTKSKRLTSI